MNLLLDPRCNETPPDVPSLFSSTVTFSGTDLTNPSEKELWFLIDDNQPTGCGIFVEMEVVYRRPDGVIENFYLVFPRSRGVPKGSRTYAFSMKPTDAGSYGAFVRSGAIVLITGTGGVTHYRLRATNYSGVRSLWGALTCFGCQPER